MNQIQCLNIINVIHKCVLMKIFLKLELLIMDILKYIINLKKIIYFYKNQMKEKVKVMNLMLIKNF